MKFTISLLLALAAATPVLANKKPVQDCKVTFALIFVGRLDNTYHGMQHAKKLKELEKKLSKYGDVCYTADEKATAQQNADCGENLTPTTFLTSL